MKTHPISRRGMVKAMGAVAGAAFAGDSLLAQRAAPPTVISNPPRDFSQPTTYFTDPDILTVDPSFDGVILPNNAIKRLWTGGLSPHGPPRSAARPLPSFNALSNHGQTACVAGNKKMNPLPHPTNNQQRETAAKPGPADSSRAP